MTVSAQPGGGRAQRTSMPIHAGAWGAWLTAVVIVLAVTRNPLYLLFVLVWIGVTGRLVQQVASQSPEAAAAVGLPPVQFSPVTFGLVVVTLSALFNALNVHVGATVLFRLPRSWPLIGGPITAEALIYGALNGVALTGLFAAFVLLHRVVPVRSLVRLAPRAFYPVAVVVTIAVTFVPATVRQFGDIREAQAIRGHRLRGLRSWLPLILPLLIGGMERALQLAEAMMARGFATTGAAQSPRTRLWTQAVLLAGLCALLVGMILQLVWRMPYWGPGLLALGGLCIAGAIRQMGKGQDYTVYRPAVWRLHDSLICAGAVVTALCFLLPLPGLDRASVFYYPYPALVWPQLDLELGMSTWGLLPPAFVLLRGLRPRRRATGGVIPQGDDEKPLEA